MSVDPSYACDQCDHSFDSSKELMVHLRKADNHEPICRACDKTFLNYDNLRHHKRKYHYEKSEFAAFVCNSCGKCCKTRDLLKDHWNYVHKFEPNLRCNLCGRNCQNMLKLKKHTKLCLNKDPEVVAQERLQLEAEGSIKYKPSEVEQIYNSSVGYESEAGEILPDLLITTQEENCFPVPVGRDTKAKESKEAKLETVKDEVSCSETEQIELEFGHFLEPKLHEDSAEVVDNNNEDTYEANEKSESELECDNTEFMDCQSYYSDTELESLVKIETEPDVLSVEAIGKKQRNKKKYFPVAKVCPICGKEVKCLNSHMKDVHTESPSERYVCNQCGKVFDKRKKLRGHVDATHKVQPSMCDICSQVFKNLHSLRGHKRKVHEEKSEVTCPSCSKVFETKLKLYYHERAVHTLEQSRCEGCNKTYKNKNLLQKHQKVYHKDLYEAQKKYPEAFKKLKQNRLNYLNI